MSRHSRNLVEVNRPVENVLLVSSTVHEVAIQRLQVEVPVVLLAPSSTHREPSLLRAGT